MGNRVFLHAHRLLSLLNFHELHDTGLGVTNSLELSAEGFGFTLDEGDVGQSTELVEAGLIGTHGLVKSRVPIGVKDLTTVGIILV